MLVNRIPPKGGTLNACFAEVLVVCSEHGEEGFLRNLYFADSLHSLLAFFLLFKKLAFASDVAAVAFGENILAERLHRFASDHFVADRRLNGHFE